MVTKHTGTSEKESVFIQYKVDTKKATKMGSIIAPRVCYNESPNSTQQAKINPRTPAPSPIPAGSNICLILPEMYFHEISLKLSLTL